MTAPFPLPDTVDIYRPLGAAVPTYSGVACRIVPCFFKGRFGQAGSAFSYVTYWVDFETTVDVRDGQTRAAGTNYNTYADGDGIRWSFQGRDYRLVVAWVEDRYQNTDKEYTRAYCVRDTVSP